MGTNKLGSCVEIEISCVQNIHWIGSSSNSTHMAHATHTIEYIQIHTINIYKYKLYYTNTHYTKYIQIHTIYTEYITTVHNT